MWSSKCSWVITKRNVHVFACALCIGYPCITLITKVSKGCNSLLDLRPDWRFTPQESERSHHHNRLEWRCLTILCFSCHLKTLKLILHHVEYIVHLSDQKYCTNIKILILSVSAPCFVCVLLPMCSFTHFLSLCIEFISPRCFLCLLSH